MKSMLVVGIEVRCWGSDDVDDDRSSFLACDNRK